MKPWDSLIFKSAARRGCSISMLEDFETMQGFKLPDDYRTFLIKVNGGKPERENAGRYAVIPISWNGRPPESTDPDTEVEYLLALEDWSSLFENERSDTLTLSGAHRMFTTSSDRKLPFGLIPIGWGSGNSPILLDVATPKRGEVSFWSRDWFDREKFETDPYHNIGHISTSFSAFIENIRFED